MHRMRATTKREPPAAIPGTRCTDRRRSGLKSRVGELSGAPVGRSAHSVHDEPRGPPATPLRCPRHAGPGRRTGDDRAKRWYIEWMSQRYDPSTIEPYWQQYWDEHETFRAERHAGRPEGVRARHVPVPVGRRAARRPSRGLHRDRHRRALQAHARLQRPAPDGLGRLRPARRAVRDQDRHAPARDHAEEHRRPSAASSRCSASATTGTARSTPPTPSYCKWTQWIFLQLFERGLAYQSRGAGELVPGARHRAGERGGHRRQERGGGHPVERMPLRQWMLRITAYADRLLDDLEELDWPETKAMQRNWIGRSEGAEVDFAVEGHAATKHHASSRRAPTRCSARRTWCSRPSTRSSPKLDDARAAAPRSTRYVDERQRARATSTAPTRPRRRPASSPARSRSTRSTATRSRSGSPTTCSAATAPARSWPCPAHDERDFEFAKKFGLPIVAGRRAATARASTSRTEAFTDDGVAVRTCARSGHRRRHAERRGPQAP